MVDAKSYVDINIFVYWLSGHPSLGETAQQWIKKLEDAPHRRYVTSSLTVYETLVIIAGLTGRSLKDRTLIEGVVESIRGLRGLEIIPFRLEDLTHAVELMQEYDVDYEDCLHLTAALRTGAEEMISNDRDFDKTPLKRVFL